MDEFNTRISIQRDILFFINSNINCTEQIFGLSNKAIERWTLANNINTNHPLISCLTAIADQLFFLANESQDQITSAYSNLTIEISKKKEELFGIVLQFVHK